MWEQLEQWEQASKFKGFGVPTWWPASWNRLEHDRSAASGRVIGAAPEVENVSAPSSVPRNAHFTGHVAALSLA